jgi:hypothetical protein
MALDQVKGTYSVTHKQGQPPDTAHHVWGWNFTAVYPQGKG